MSLMGELRGVLEKSAAEDNVGLCTKKKKHCVY